MMLIKKENLNSFLDNCYKNPGIGTYTIIPKKIYKIFGLKHHVEIIFVTNYMDEILELLK